ncbi:MAG TPA: glycosyltransferase family 4 protein [Opitutus sp.]|nr:glycosyltransferase family 4 protein [Opitutus sp.]
MTGTVTPAPLFGLETPHPLQPTQNYFQLIGWAFLPKSEAEPGSAADREATLVSNESGRISGTANQVRIVVNQETFLPVERINRPDVASTFPNEPAALGSGFKFICYLPFGFYTGRLEISTDGTHWQSVCPLAIPVSSHPILGAIEKPPADSIITEPIRIEGWCFHPEFYVREIVLQFGNVEVPCEYGIARPDVASRFPANARAQSCGFITNENLPRGSGPVKIRATTTCGRVYFVRSEHIVDITSGWIPKPPPPSPVRDLSTLAHVRTTGTASAPSPGVSGNRNILFVLYGDFSANSALHVASLANELVALGYDCVVAVPEHKETVGALPEANFMAVQFDELPALSTYFKDGNGPCILHAWTSRENVRKFSAKVVELYRSAVFVHLEDNERDILETRLKRPFAELAALPEAELDLLVPDVLSHPQRAAEFLQSAIGVTLIVDRLKEQVPSDRPTEVIWPAADARHFKSLPRDDRLRAALGIVPSDIVLFYHGNTHTSNAGEVRSLYEAVALLNERSLPTQLIRTGRDFPDFLPAGDAWIRPYLIHLGHIGRAKHLPALMALADYFVQPGLPDAFNDYRFPSKLPEFFSIGRPVILPKTNLGGFLRHGEDAWVLPSANGPAIADAIATLHADPALSDKLARGALAFASTHFSWSRSAAKLAAFYRSLTPLAAPASS